MVEKRLLAHAAHHPQVLLELAAAIVELLVHQVHDIHAVVSILHPLRLCLALLAAQHAAAARWRWRA